MPPDSAVYNPILVRNKRGPGRPGPRDGAVWPQNASLATTNIFLAVPEVMLLTFMNPNPPVSWPFEFRVGAVVGFPTPVLGNTIRLNGLYISTRISKYLLCSPARAIFRPYPISSCGDRRCRKSVKRGAPQPNVAVGPHSIQAAGLSMSCCVGSILPFTSVR